MNAMSFPTPQIIVISDDEEVPERADLDAQNNGVTTAADTHRARSNSPIVINSVNDLPLPPPFSGYTRPMTTDIDWEQDDSIDGSWFESDEGEYDLLDDPFIEQMSVAIESEMDGRTSTTLSEHDEGSTVVSYEGDAIAQLRADIQQRIDLGVIHRPYPAQQTVPEVPNPVFHQQPSFAGSLPPAPPQPILGHVFFAPSAQVLPESPESPPMSEQGQLNDAMEINQITDLTPAEPPSTPQSTTVTSPIPWDIVPDEELDNTCAICGNHILGSPSPGSSHI